MGGSLEEIGWVQSVIVNKRSGRIVDGHLRVDLAISENAPTVPVVYVDLSDEEERLALAVIDPIGAMAGRSEELFASLVADLAPGSEALEGLIHPASAPEGGEASFTYQEKYAVTVMCKDAADQERIYNELVERGYECRVVVV